MTKKISKPPVVVVLGHVDHGKTTILDGLRQSNLAKKESGGITQHIGAYEMKTKEGKKITFVDTPGHEAFTNLRARGAQSADIALLVIAADASVQPQTKEALTVIRKNKIPFIVVINKIDLEKANFEKVIKDLGKQKVLIEGRGGETPLVKVSGKNKTGFENLLDLIILLAEIEKLKYNPQASVEGLVIETKKDNRGVVLSIIINDGHLKIGDKIFIEKEELKVRAMFNDQGQRVSEILPSTPVELLGSKLIHTAGTIIKGEQIKTGTEIQDQTQNIGPIKAETFFQKPSQKFNFIIKADTYGTLETIEEKLSQFEEIKVVQSGVGNLNEAEVELAKTAKASIVLFRVKASRNLEQRIERENINVFEFILIYELLDQVGDLVYSLRVNEEKEAKKVGEARVMAKFSKEKLNIAGLKVISGRIKLDDQVEIIRGKKSLGETTISSLYFKSNPIPEAKKGEECGALFNPKLDFQQGDIVKLYIP